MPKTINAKIGSLSWIHQQVSPVWFMTDAAFLFPNWVPKTYIGLYCTRNPAPPIILDLTGYQGSKQFRAMTLADFTVELSSDGLSLRDVTLNNYILDGGYTPPFDRTVSIATRIYVPEPSMSDPNYHRGEIGAATGIRVRALQPNTTIARSFSPETIVGSGMILFRAGKVTDDIGVSVVQSPYHVPWVWCEWVLTFADGKFSAYGTGSVFPTHSFYFQGISFGQQDEPTDARFVRSWRHPLTIDTSTLSVYPVLTTGAPATGPQASDTTFGVLGPITAIPYVVRGSGTTSETF